MKQNTKKRYSASKIQRGSGAEPSKLADKPPPPPSAKPRSRSHSSSGSSSSKFVKKPDAKVSYDEFRIQKIAYDAGIPTPKPISFFQKGEDEFGTLKMKKIKGKNLAEKYDGSEGDFSKLPEKIQTEIRRLVSELLKHGIEYVDITSYNFVEEEKTGKLFIIDFGHAKFFEEDEKKLDENSIENRQIVGQFLKGKRNTWNPNFL